MIWKAIYLAVFVGGLALAVHAMLHGAERWRRRRSARPSAAFNPPTVAALAAGFGACGYLLVTRTTLGSVAALVLAILTGVAAFAGMTVLMAKWALRGAPSASFLEEEEIHGQVATVTREISGSEPGEISWFAWEKRHVLPAQSVDGSVIATGTEVVIEMIDDGVARVELWSVVEQRL